MKQYVKASLTSGLVGIWWYYNSKVIGRVVTLDQGYDDGRFIHYDDFKNHASEWKTVLQEQLPEEFSNLYPRRFKCIERGRVVYNIRTMSYEIICSEAFYADDEGIQAVVDAFELNNCRYDIVTDHHYYLREPTGNPELDRREYEGF